MRDYPPRLAPLIHLDNRHVLSVALLVLHCQVHVVYEIVVIRVLSNIGGFSGGEVHLSTVVLRHALIFKVLVDLGEI